MKHLKYCKISQSIQEFIDSKANELKDIPTYYYNRNNIHAVIEYLGLEHRYIVRDGVLYKLYREIDVKECEFISGDTINIIKETK